MEIIRRDYNNGKTVLKILNGKTPVSKVIMLDMNTIGCYIEYVATAKNHRRKGYADKILEEVIKICKASMYSAVRLHVLSDNEPAIQLYKKHGFFKVYKTDDRFYLMVKKL